MLAYLIAVLDRRQFFLEARAVIIKVRYSITNKENVRIRFKLEV
jgi:hypothetical protein